MGLIGKRIRELRRERGFTQGDVERGTGMLRAYVSRVEHGRTVPSLESVERFAAFFRVPLHEMFRLAPEDGDGPGPEGRGAAFLSLLAGYVRRMGVPERDLLVELATRFADSAAGRPLPAPKLTRARQSPESLRAGRPERSTAS